MRFLASLLIIVGLLANSFVMSVAQVPMHNNLNKSIPLKSHQVVVKVNKKGHDCCKQCICLPQSDCKIMQSQTATIATTYLLLLQAINNMATTPHPYCVSYAQTFLERIDRPPIA